MFNDAGEAQVVEEDESGWGPWSFSNSNEVSKLRQLSKLHCRLHKAGSEILSPGLRSNQLQTSRWLGGRLRQWNFRTAVAE